MGLSIAYALARRGILSTIIERDALGRAASWAGAGMIAPLSEIVSAEPMIRLRTWSAALFAEWSEALLRDTGIDNGYLRCGGVDIALTEREDHELKGMAGRWRLEGIVFEKLAAADIRRVEPALTPDVRAAYFLPDRAQVRNPRHTRALSAACERMGVVMRTETEVLGFRNDGGAVTAVVTENEEFPCDIAIASAGPWTSRLLTDLGLAERIPTPPVKGQIVLLHDPTGVPPLKRVVERGKNYLVPRADGRILVGATEEHAGFDISVDDDASRRLLEEAFLICPGLNRLPVETAWAGLRPGSLDTRPYIGPAPGFPNLLIAAGHNRAGLQLSTGTAVMIADLIDDQPPQIDLSAFRPGRAPIQEPPSAIRS